MRRSPPRPHHGRRPGGLPPGARQSGERHCRFWGHGYRAFEVLTGPGAEVPSRYPAGRPRRYVIDIPYAPTMADQVL